MFYFKNKIDEQKYNNLMYTKKEKVQNEFFNASLKRKLIFPFLKNTLFRRLLKNIVPYSYSKINKNTNYYSNNKIAVYTAVYGNYDRLYNPQTKPNNCDFFIFTDNDLLQNNIIWNKKEFTPKWFNEFSNSEKNRYIKMHPHELFPDYKYSVYIDGNIEIVTDFTEFIQDFNVFGLKLHNHYRRKCVYKEIDECILHKKASIEELLKYKEKLINEKIPYNYGLLEAPIIVREHNNKKCIKIMNEWWKEYKNYIKRDQIALIYVLYKNHIKPFEIAELGEDIHSNYSFIQHTHNK